MTSPTESTAPRWLRVIFMLNLVAQTGIVLTGGLVRLTGSGLGCPTWPQCAAGSYVPTQHQEESWHKYVEFGNRTLTFLLTLLAIAALVGAIAWGRKHRKPIVWLSAAPLVGTFAQAALGGIIVLTGLNPGIVAAHFLISAALIAACLVLYVRSGEPSDQPVEILVKKPIRVLSWVLVAVTAVVLTLGTVVTGSGPHSGDEAVAGRFGFDPQMVAWMHADLVLLFLGLTIGLLVALLVTDSPTASRHWAWILIGVIVLQGAIGYTQYFTGLPWLIVLMHLLGACLVWIAVLALHLSMRSRGTALMA